MPPAGRFGQVTDTAKRIASSLSAALFCCRIAMWPDFSRLIRHLPGYSRQISEIRITPAVAARRDAIISDIVNRTMPQPMSLRAHF
jgi:hypothetical protein